MMLLLLRCGILTNKVHNKETNEHMHSGITVFEPRTPARKGNTMTTELKRILPYAVVKYCI